MSPRGRKNGQLDDATGLRHCVRCGEVKPVEQFGTSENRKGRRYLKSHCRACAKLARSDWYYKKGGADWHRKYNKLNPARLTATIRRSRLKTIYGLTPEGYDLQLAEQGGGCALCKKPPTRKRLAVDHDHTTGKRRGLLCGSCNTALGCFQDSPESLRAAARYLEGYL